MTAPVPVFERTSLLNTRRIIGGMFHLRPDPALNQNVQYALAYAANKYDIGLYAVACLSNHIHVPFYDPNGRHPEFRRDFHSLLTRATNVLRETQEGKWSPGHKSPVILHDVEAMLDRIAYTIANPARHDLVDDPWDWPGVVTRIEELAGPPTYVAKPEAFFDLEGDLPEEVPLRFVKPPLLEDWTDDEYRQVIASRVDAHCEAARNRRQSRRIPVLGRRRILAQSPTDTPKTQPEPRTLNPLVACRIKRLRIAFLIWLQEFRQKYRKARRLFEGGHIDVEFPFGTYWLMRRYGVNCDAVGPPMPGSV
ncbi:MAG: hypothetical protein KDC38_14205 [Planctomycetes bacterium]|nr:hypothetical protein [Planctomycetota bacterium]